MPPTFSSARYREKSEREREAGPSFFLSLFLSSLTMSKYTMTSSINRPEDFLPPSSSSSSASNHIYFQLKRGMDGESVSQFSNILCNKSSFFLFLYPSFLTERREGSNRLDSQNFLVLQTLLSYCFGFLIVVFFFYFFFVLFFFLFSIVYTLHTQTTPLNANESMIL
jgi:hypothetical protein